MKIQTVNNFIQSARICKERMKMLFSTTFISQKYQKIKIKMKNPNRSKRKSSQSLKLKQPKRNQARETSLNKWKNPNAQTNENYEYLIIF